MENMDLIFSKIVNRERRAVEMLFYGDLSDRSEPDQINGHQFARELNYLAREYDEIKIRVNSNGGDVDHGLSIVSEMMASPAFIIVQVDGIAASMAAVLLSAADKVTMNDYAKVMIHSPYYVDENGELIKNLSAKFQKSLNSIKGTLKTLLGKRGIDEGTVNIMMRTDTWFTAEEALEAKLIDEIITTGRKKLAALEPMRLVAQINNEHINSNFKSMKKVIAKLNGFGLSISDDANEDQVVAALEGFEKPATVEKPSERLVNQLVALGVKTGVVTEGDDGNEAKFRKLAAADMELFVDLLGIDKLGTPTQKPAPQARMSEIIAQAKAAAKTPAADEKTFDWYEKNDPQALAKMETTEPEKFAKLQAADKARYE